MSNTGPLCQTGPDGRLRLSTSGQIVLASANAPCCCGSGTATDPCTNAPSSVAITGYYDGFFTACPDGAPAVVSDCVWPGIFWFVSGTPCGYSNYNCFDAHIINGQNCYDCQMSGTRMWQLDPPGPSQITYDAATGVFTLQIVCQNNSGNGEIVWSGQQTGTSFTGTYQRTGGCDTHASIEIS